MDITVFYAWQDDRPGKVNRYLIRDAAEEACRQISEDSTNEYSLKLDQDTAGRPGMCDIPNTILKKIRNCDILLADLTFVGQSDTKSANEKPQLIPNPNVTLELGYAVGFKASEEFDGFDPVIAVMNTAFGDANGQMFDVKRRHAIRYNLPADADKTAIGHVRKSLANDIKDALLTILKKVTFPKKGKPAEERFKEIRAKFESDIREQKFHDLHRARGVIAISLVPTNHVQVPYSRLNEVGFLPMAGKGCFRPEPLGKSRLFIWPYQHDNTPEAVTEITVDGVVLAAESLTLRPHLVPMRRRLGAILCPQLRWRSLWCSTCAGMPFALIRFRFLHHGKSGFPCLGLKASVFTRTVRTRSAEHILTPTSFAISLKSRI